MANLHCLKCGGDGKMANGLPCPDCSKEVVVHKIINVTKSSAPRQYQGIVFNKDFVNMNMGTQYPKFLETLMSEILNLGVAYNTNHVICSRIGTSKTIWAYTLLANLDNKSISNVGIMNLQECKDVMTSWDKDKMKISDSMTKCKCLIVRIPRNANAFLFDTIQSIIEARVINDGYTIFLFGGTEEDLDRADTFGKLKNMKGNGSFNTVKIDSFK